jgi:hypothetical protein
MHKSRCSQCRLMKVEGAKNFLKRVGPFVCRECRIAKNKTEFPEKYAKIETLKKERKKIRDCKWVSLEAYNEFCRDHASYVNVKESR